MLLGKEWHPCVGKQPWKPRGQQVAEVLLGALEDSATLLTLGHKPPCIHLASSLHLGFLGDPKKTASLLHRLWHLVERAAIPSGHYPTHPHPVQGYRPLCCGSGESCRPAALGHQPGSAHHMSCHAQGGDSHMGRRASSWWPGPCDFWIHGSQGPRSSSMSPRPTASLWDFCLYKGWGSM